MWILLFIDCLPMYFVSLKSELIFSKALSLWESCMTCVKREYLITPWQKANECSLGLENDQISFEINFVSYVMVPGLLLTKNHCMLISWLRSFQTSECKYWGDSQAKRDTSSVSSCAGGQNVSWLPFPRGCQPHVSHLYVGLQGDVFYFYLLPFASPRFHHFP